MGMGLTFWLDDKTHSSGGGVEMAEYECEIMVLNVAK